MPCEVALEDTGLKEKLLQQGLVEEKSMPRVVNALHKKLCSSCVDFALDFRLHCLWEDLVLAKKLSAIVNVAEKRCTSIDNIAADMQQFALCWTQQQRRLEDVCRQLGSFPNLFVTIAPAEWSFTLHDYIFDAMPLKDVQVHLTFHFYNCLKEILLKLLRGEYSEHDTGIASVDAWAMRFEFQKRGTLHVHLLCWAHLTVPIAHMVGRTGRTSSLLLRFLERFFAASIDIQAGDTNHCLLRYVAGYVSKASDCMLLPTLTPERSSSASWKQVFRLLSRRTPMWQELALDFAGLPLVLTSFGALKLLLPSQDSKDDAVSTLIYKAYLARTEHHELGFLNLFRKVIVKIQNGKIIDTRPRPPGDKVAVSLTFPFEFLDLFAKAWAMAFVKIR